MPHVYVYVTDVQYAEGQRWSTSELSDTVNVDRLAGEITGVEVLGAACVEIDGNDATKHAEAMSILCELVAGADDHRCWWIPSEVEPRIRALVEGMDGET